MQADTTTSRVSHMIKVDKGDLEPVKLPLDEVSFFVRSYFGDNTDGRNIPNEVDCDSTIALLYKKKDEIIGEVIYVEDEITGEFRRVKAIAHPFDEKAMVHDAEDVRSVFTAEGGEGMHSADSIDLSVPSDPVIARYVTLMQVFYFAVQGLLAGFSFVILYSQSLSGSDTTLLETYQPYASEYRRFFYILTTVSLVGSVDMLLSLPYFHPEKLLRRGPKVRVALLSCCVVRECGVGRDIGHRLNNTNTVHFSYLLSLRYVSQ